MSRALAIFWLLILLGPLPAAAQSKAVLIADRITIEAGNRLRAEGNVEVLFQGARLRASAITYNRARDRITIEGPLSLSQGDDFVLLADEGELDRDFRNGVLLSARLVLDQRMQVAGAELSRVDGRYTQLFRAVASTCPVCDSSDVPAWQIRARRVIHDQDTRRIYYENALFEVYGIPVFYVPRMRMADPTVKRATGFLIPRFKTSSVLGTGVQIPYFVAIGDHADVTLRPYLSPETTTLGFGYRQLLRTGAISFNGAISDDTLTPGELRGYLFGSGVFFLPRDYELRFAVELSSDDSYLFDYSISEQDRLRSDLTLNRVRRASYFSASVIDFESFRDNEAGTDFPAQIGQIDTRKEINPGIFGGRAEYRFEAYGLARPSSDDITGRDYARLSAGLGWRRDQVFGPGLLFEAEADVSLDHYIISQDSTTQGGTEVTSTAAAGLSWPLTKRTGGGAVHVLEPRLQLVFSDARTSSVPNEESTLVEFDEGSLWSLDRLPGTSAYETGNRLNAGITWTRHDPENWSAALAVGRVFRDRDPNQFNAATGLQGYASDWLFAVHLDLGPEFDATSRLLLADDLSIDRNDTRLRWSPGAFDLSANFLWHIAEPQVGRDQDTWELHADAAFPLGRYWAGSADLRYDFVAARAAAAGLTLSYQTRCVTADFGFSRTFTSSASVEPRTDFTITLSVPRAAVASQRPNIQCGG